MKYKYVGSADLGNTISLPDGWIELIVITANSANRPSLQFIVPYQYLDGGTEKTISNGYYADSAYYGYAMLVCRKEWIKLNEHTHVGSNVDGSKILVYYR